MYERINSGPGMGTQEVLRIATPLLMQARPFNSNNSQTSSPSGDNDPLCAGCAPDSGDVEPLPTPTSDEPFTLEQSGPSWWVWGGLAVLVLGGAAGAGYWFWYRPRQIEQDTEEV